LSADSVLGMVDSECCVLLVSTWEMKDSCSVWDRLWNKSISVLTLEVQNMI